MRQALPAATLLLTLLGGTVRAAPSPAPPAVSCAVRLRTVSGNPAKTAALPSVLAALSHPPTAVRPLLAGAGDRGAEPGPRHPLAAWQILHFDTAAACAAAVAELRSHPAVDFVEPIRVIPLEEVERDDARLGPPALAFARVTPARTLERAPARAGATPAPEIPWNVDYVHAPAAIAEVQPDTTIVVAVIDTGADLTHPDLVRRLWRNDDPPGNARTEDDARDQNGDGAIEEWERDDDDDNGYVDDEHGFDFTDAPGQNGVGDALDRDPDPSDEDGHGTHVAGIIAADGRLRGVAPFVRLMPVRAGFARIFGAAALETDDAAAAIVYAVDNGARILNLSWGDTEESRLIQDAIAYAAERGVVIVAAAGNGGTADPFWPSADPHVIGVAASNRSGARAGFSSFGPAVQIAAPGEEAPFPGAGIRSLEPLALVPGGIGERRGTSMAAPHVAGAAAIVMSRSDRPDARRVRALLVAGAHRAGAADWTPDLGHGELDVLGAVRTADDLVVAVLGPAAPYRAGAFALIGTVLSGTELRRSVVARHTATGFQTQLLAGASGQVVADTLVRAAFAGMPEGDWEYIVAVDTADRRRRERHGVFHVDTSPPGVDTLLATSAWRGGAPHWLFTLACDDPVRVEVRDAASGTALLADAGFARRVQIDSPAGAGGGGWRVDVENAAGLSTAIDVPAPQPLAAWPEAAGIDRLDLRADFQPEPVLGRTPTGEPAVWGRAGPADRRTAQAWGVAADRLVPLYDTRREGRPVASGDTNGDGVDDLLMALPGSTARFVWILSRGPSFPDSIFPEVAAGAALGFFQLDDDPVFESLFATDDELLVYDDAEARAPALVQTLVNPSHQGFNVWGADAAVGDVDADGRIEIVCGDAEGNVTVFERAGGRYVVERTLDTHGTYAYDLSALPAGGFLVGCQRTTDPGGDGFPAAVYEFQEYRYEPEGPTVIAAYPFLAPENSLRAGSSVVRSTSTMQTWIFLVQGQDLHLLRGDAAPRERVAHVAGAAGEAPVAADLDADGRVEIVLGTAGGAALFRIHEPPGPHSLRSESRGTGIVLSWVPGTGQTSRLRRGSDGIWQTLGETNQSAWFDSTVVPFATYDYEVEGVVGTEVRGVSNRVRARAQPRPRLLFVESATAASLRLSFSNPVHAASVAPHRFAVRGPDGPRRILQVNPAAAGRTLVLSLDAPLPCGGFEVQVDSLRDDQWGLLDPPVTLFSAQRPCTAPPFFIVRVGLAADARGIDVDFSREPDAAALVPATWQLSWSGARLEIARVDRLDVAQVRLVPGTGVEFRGRGVPYLVQVDPGLRARDGTPLESPETVYRVLVTGAGGAAVHPVPNPARPSDTAVVFVEAAPDTRVRIYDLEGELVRDLRGPVGGGLTWDLRNGNGARVAAGAYLYVASDASGTSHGTLAVSR